MTSVLMIGSLTVGAANAVLAAILLLVYRGVYARTKAPFSLALFLFAAAFLAHNLLMIYALGTMMDVVPGVLDPYLLGVVALDVPRQRVVTRDNVSVEVDAVVYYRVYDPLKAVTEVQNYVMATNLLAQTTLRDVLGQVELDELLSKREELSKRIQVLLDIATEPWGIKVSAVTLRDVSLPDTMVRAIAKQAEAE